MSDLETAARAYCAAKEADRVLRLGMTDCEKRETVTEREHAFDDYWIDVVFDSVSPCWQRTSFRDHETGEPHLDKWCPSCLHSREIIAESRKIRARFGGLASAMMAAYRSEIR